MTTPGDSHDCHRIKLEQNVLKEKEEPETVTHLSTREDQLYRC